MRRGAPRRPVRGPGCISEAVTRSSSSTHRVATPGRERPVEHRPARTRARCAGAPSPRRGAPTGPTIGGWTRVWSPRWSASTATSCAPARPTGRRRRTVTPSWRSGPAVRGRLLAELRRLLLTGTRLRPDDVHAVARLLVLAERRRPRTLLDGLPADLLEVLARAVVASPAGSSLGAGIDVWDGAEPPEPAEPAPGHRPPPALARPVGDAGVGGSGGRLHRVAAPAAPDRSVRSAAAPYGRSVTDIAADRARLLDIVRDKAVVHGRVTLSSGAEADYYVDLRRITLDGEASPLVGRVMLDLVADLDFDAVGGLTLGADPVATSMLHARAAAGGRLDAFVVRKAGKAHGLQQRIEGPSIAGPPGPRRRGHLDHRRLPARRRPGRAGGRRDRRRRRDDRRPRDRRRREVRRRRARVPARLLAAGPRPRLSGALGSPHRPPVRARESP